MMIYSLFLKQSLFQANVGGEIVKYSTLQIQLFTFESLNGLKNLFLELPEVTGVHVIQTKKILFTDDGFKCFF